MARDWNAAYETGETPWDKGYASPPLGLFLERRRVEGRVLVPGCGTGHDVRLLAGQGAEVLGLDVAPNALKLAEKFERSGQETYALGDFLSLDPAHHEGFDWVFEHTCLCAIEPGQRAAYVQSVQRSLRPNGYYLAVFFREVSDYTGDGPPHPVSREESSSLFGDGFEQIDAFVPKDSYPGRPFGAEEVVLFRKRAPVTRAEG